MKKLLLLAAAVGAGYLGYNEYNRRKEAGDEFILKLDSQIHNLIDDIGAKIDSSLAAVEKKLEKVEEEVAEKVEEI